jgi:amidase
MNINLKRSADMMYDQILTRDKVHLYFDKSNEPILWIQPSQTVKVETERADWMVLTEASPVFLNRQEVLEKGANPVTGPIWVEGAEPGDKLAISILEMIPCADGSLAYVTLVPGPSALMPPFSLRPEFQPETIWCKIENQQLSFPLKHKEIKIPVEPFLGTIGVAPGEERRASYWYGQDFAGNIDCPSVTVGSTTVIPVNVKGALLSLGDMHAKQGHGEVSGCAVECRGDVIIRVDLLKQDEAQYFEWPQVNNQNYIGSVGCIMSSLEHSARAALYDLTKRVETFYGFELIDAYQLVAQCVEFEICQMIYPHYTCLARVNRRYL